MTGFRVWGLRMEANIISGLRSGGLSRCVDNGGTMDNNWFTWVINLLTKPP